jgi:hypothetical protein
VGKDTVKSSMMNVNIAEGCQDDSGITQERTRMNGEMVEGSEQPRGMSIYRMVKNVLYVVLL